MATLLTIDMIPRVGHQWRYPTKFIITQNLTDPSYLIDGYDGDKFDFTLNGDVDLELDNIKEGVEYKFVLTVDRANAAIQRPAKVYFSSLQNYCIIWAGVTGETVDLYDSGEVIIYRSGSIIYAKFTQDFSPNYGAGSDCQGVGYNPTIPKFVSNNWILLDNSNASVGSPYVVDLSLGTQFMIDASVADIKIIVDREKLNTRSIILKTIGVGNNIIITTTDGLGEFEFNPVPYTITGLIQGDSFTVSSNGTDLLIT